MRSLLLWAALLLYFGTGNVPVPLVLLFMAFLVHFKFRPSSESSGSEQIKRRKAAVRPIWKSAAKGKAAAVAIHQGILLEATNSKRFTQILNANLHFLLPLNKEDAALLMQEAATEAIAGSNGRNLANLITIMLPGATEADIDSLSETAIRKVQAAITQIRAERIEAIWYIWRTCQDQRVRASHAMMEGVVCSYLDPPRPEALIGEPELGAYHPGEARECRCYAEPIVDSDFETWPKLAVVDGKLVTIDVRAFKSLAKVVSR